MRPRSLPLALFSSSIFVSALFAVSTARADDDCPAGAYQKTEDGFTWCQPSVCQTDGQCNPNEVCRPVGLCMEVGALADAGAKGGAGKRLVVTQRCAPDKTCPQLQTCSDIGRCLSKTTAEKMGILTASTATSASATPASGEPARKSCGCRAVGTKESGSEGAIGALFALAIVLLRRREADPR